MAIRFNNRFFLRNRSLNKWLGFLVAVTILILTIVISNSIVQKLKDEERKKMETIVQAIELQGNAFDISDETRSLTLKITQDNTSMPMILVDESGIIADIINMGDEHELLLNDSVYLANKLNEMAVAHTPIEVELPFGTQKIYYENSSLLTQLRYYPVVLVLIILGFTFFTIWYFRTLNESQKSFLWAGMAKETAHQIGTPLSSLLGWIELLKLEDIDQTIVHEMGDDVKRLNQIAERFSKIGSVPELEKNNIAEVCRNTYAYLQPRISSGIDFQFRVKPPVIMAACNPELLSWVIENLVRNAVDAMQNRGKIEFMVYTSGNHAVISIRDNGPGIPAGLQKRIFEPGYTTKKRGWGLGLSLAKRIINDYHKGKIYVAESGRETGTQFIIRLKLSH